jgi:hypothetical protein
MGLSSKNHQQPPSLYESFLSPCPPFHSVVILGAFEIGACNAGEARCSTIVSRKLSAQFGVHIIRQDCGGVRICTRGTACLFARQTFGVRRSYQFLRSKIYLSTTEESTVRYIHTWRIARSEMLVGKPRSRIHVSFVGGCLLGRMS